MDLNVVAFLVKHGHSYDYALGLDEYEKMLTIAIMEAEEERRAELWQRSSVPR